MIICSFTVIKTLLFVTRRVSTPTSPDQRYSPVTTTKRVVEKRSNYKMYSSFSGSQDNLDQGSPYSSLETDRVRRLGSPGKSNMYKFNCFIYERSSLVDSSINLAVFIFVVFVVVKIRFVKL